MNLSALTPLFCFIPDLDNLKISAANRQKGAARPGTWRNRQHHFVTYLAFCSHFRLQDIPAAPSTLILFMEFLLRSYRNPKSATNALASIRFLHQVRGASIASFHDFSLSQTLRALPRTVRHVPAPALPCHPSVLSALCSTAATDGPRGIVFRALCTLAFSTLARLSSLVPDKLPFDSSRYPVIADLAPAREGFQLRIKFSKTAQLPSQAFVVPVLPQRNQVTCPVRALLALWRLHPSPSPATPLFLWPGDGALDLSQASPLTAARARHWLRQTLVQAGFAPDTLTFHSFRRGGCTAAALQGACIDDLKALGDWHSDAVLAYMPTLPARGRAARLLQEHLDASHPP